jgi:uncharacterized protein
MSCSSSEELETIKLVSNEKEIELKVEIADEPHEHNEGLMGREKLKEDHGMLFVFEKSQRVSFWMKNTLIPLDIIFFDQDGKYISMNTMHPCTEDPCPQFGSGKYAKYALEVNAGFEKQEWDLDLASH